MNFSIFTAEKKNLCILLGQVFVMFCFCAVLQESAAAYCLILMAVFWATEAFPIAVTALLPVMLFPMTGLMPGKQVSKQYINVSLGFKRSPLNYFNRFLFIFIHIKPLQFHPKITTYCYCLNNIFQKLRFSKITFF